MATISIEVNKNRADLRQYIERGTSRLQLDGASPDLENHIRDSLEMKAQGMFLWVKLMLEVLEAQTTEQDILDHLAAAPADVDGVIREVLKVYSSTLNGKEAEELNTVIAWMSCAVRPLNMSELDAILRRTSPTGSRVLSLEMKLREKFGSLITLVRDDGLTTGMLQSRTQRSDHQPIFDSIPETTTIVFSHASITEYFQRGEGRHSARKTAPKIGVVRSEAHYMALTTCLDVFVSPGKAGRSEEAETLQSYAKEHWLVHLGGCISVPPSATTQTRTSANELLHQFLTNADSLRGWCYDKDWSFYSEEAVKIIALWTDTWSKDLNFGLDDDTKTWIVNCQAKPESVFSPAASIYALEGLHGEIWPPVPAILALVCTSITKFHCSL